MGLRRYIAELREALEVTTAADWRKLKNLVGREMDKAGFDGNRSFQSISNGLSTLGSILAKYGLEWDDVLNADLFRGDKGTRTLHIAFSNPNDAFSPKSIDNSLLSFSWYKRQSGSYELTAYLS